ncbi:hypothetical protein QAD02_014567 [Eretmocerus hayati]|uniref:Uncharacterized protein n=1 Tax=Eretmocerus hayati TaxID=131215 RepID=A0ACC2PAL1_9HYME|nr:hypothetical protein QAD02_014567 [Eretmocerus hayati]
MPARRRARLGGLAALLLALLQLLVGAGWRGGPPQCLAAAFPDWAECPAVCNCKWTSGKRSALCNGKGLTSLPTLDPDMQILDLSGNRIVELQDSVFKTVKLLNLQKVFLRNSSLERVHQHAFIEMKGLVEVDLSDNGIASLEPETFTGNDRLRFIALSGNPIVKLSSQQFPKLPHLRVLELRSCHLATIHRHAFRNVPFLEKIR